MMMIMLFVCSGCSGNIQDGGIYMHAISPPPLVGAHIDQSQTPEERAQAEEKRALIGAALAAGAQSFGSHPLGPMGGEPVSSYAPPAMVGSCYGAPPICIGSNAICLCDVTQQCWWACR